VIIEQHDDTAGLNIITPNFEKLASGILENTTRQDDEDNIGIAQKAYSVMSMLIKRCDGERLQDQLQFLVSELIKRLNAEIDSKARSSLYIMMICCFLV
jgi:hypothetical protein